MGQVYALCTGKKTAFALGIGITLAAAALAKWIAGFPFFSIMGQLVIAMLLGMAVRAAADIPQQSAAGAAFAAKRLLRCGIVLLGMRLNLLDIVHAGPKVLVIAVIHIGFTIAVVLGLARVFRVEKRLGILTACGTAICGAAAVVAISPQLKANEEETAVGAATVAMLGTIFTLLYTVLYPFLGLSDADYGIFAGGTLHEVAHVIAAAAPGGREAVDLAVVVKLTRVALLVPVALAIGAWTRRQENRAAEAGARKPIPVPWFIFGFLTMCGVHTLGIMPQAAADLIVAAAYLLIAMAMAGLGLQVEIAVFRRMGMQAFKAGLIGSILLSLLGYGLVILL